MRRAKNHKTQRYSDEYVRSATGVAWYGADDWRRLREVVVDPELLARTYEEWVVIAEQAIGELESRGILIERVSVDAERLIAWCRKEGRPINSAARAAYAAHRFREIHLSQADGDA